MRVGPRNVSIAKFIELNGQYTEEAIRVKIARGVWRFGGVVRKAPDGHVMINIDSYDEWVEGSLETT